MDQLDIRFPLGLLFLSLGCILIVYGVFADPQIYITHSLGQNINLVWGGLFTLFGAVVVWLSRRKQNR